MTPKTWVDVPAGSPFPITNLPYGAFTLPRQRRARLGIAIGEQVLDLAAAIPEIAALRGPTLNRFLAAGPAVWAQVRDRVVHLLTDERSRAVVEPLLVPSREARLHLPFEVADFVDFYSSQVHARNVGRMFRPGQPALMPNWTHLPVGYHGRAGTVRVSGTPVRRPAGQFLPAAGGLPIHAPTSRLDIEAELGWVVGVGSALGQPVSLGSFRDHVFGACLVNDWSARDLQSWESKPLGPFLGKSFLTSVSPWVVPLAALDAAWVPPPPRTAELLPYLADQGRADGLRVSFDVRLNGHSVSRPPFASMYWTGAQQVAHLTSNGAALRTGDLLGSGTVSGSDPGEFGSLIELSWNGERPIRLPDGTTRTFLQDGDEIVIEATAPGTGGTTIGFGTVRGTVG